jgi:hypothetical protein
MKTRSGFVSNSSSSSFIILGTEVTDKIIDHLGGNLSGRVYDYPDALQELGAQKNLDVLYRGGESYLIGKIFSNDETLDNNEKNIGEILTVTQKIKDTIGNNENVRLIFGTIHH